MSDLIIEGLYGAKHNAKANHLPCYVIYEQPCFRFNNLNNAPSGFQTQNNDPKTPMLVNQILPVFKTFHVNINEEKPIFYNFVVHVNVKFYRLKQ
jgi:hypothetical protein